jgi:hypothetical protein
MNAYVKPLPLIDEQNRPFWDAAKAHELRLPQCGSCGHIRVQFERWCPQCGSRDTQWTLLSGRGKVWSHCTFHRKYFPEFEDELPYNVALVQLEEGPRLITNIVGIDRQDIRIDMPVQVSFDDVTPTVTLVKFRPTSRETNPV